MAKLLDVSRKFVTIFRAFVAAFVLFWAATSGGQIQGHKRPRIALVLEGGGALGFAHLGAIEYLEQHHIPIDFVAGTSMGGLIGGLYASGDSPAQIRQLVSQINWDHVLSGDIPFPDVSYRRKQDQIAYPNRLEFGLRHGLTLPSGLNSGQSVGLILDQAVLPTYNVINFDQLPIPFRCVATDLTTGDKKVFDSGSLAQALRATMSIPGVFAPVTIDGHSYADGGAVDNLPVDVAKKAGADIVIAVYLDTGPTTTAEDTSFLTTAGKTIAIMIKANELQSLREADILLTVDLKGFTSSSFNSSAKIIPKGYAAAEKRAGLLDALALNDQQWKAYVAERDARIHKTVPVPEFVDVVGAGKSIDGAIQKAMEPMVGKPINPKQIDKELTRAVGTGELASAGYAISEANGEHGLLVRATPKAYGPPFLKLGITIDGSDVEDVLFGMGGLLTMQNLGGYRSELRVDGYFGSGYGATGEYYRPFTESSLFFVAPHAYATRTRFDLYEDASKVSEFEIQRNGFGADVGYTGSRNYEIRAGEQLQWYSTISLIDYEAVPNQKLRQQITSLKYTYYGTDNAQLPRSGTGIQFNLDWHHNMDPGTAFTKANLQIRSFLPISKEGSIFFTGAGGTAFGASAANLDLQGFSLGGPFHLSSYGIHELIGGQYFLFQSGYEHKVLPLNPFIGEGIYALVFLEGGKMYDNLTTLDSGQTPFDGTIAIVARTALGPVYVGTSYGTDNHHKWWFGLRPLFP
ncbi:MAG TPA: patatin-like phospholipase family protein [Acidobacteriaceae bacterium]